MKRKGRPSTPEERAWYRHIHDEIKNCVMCGRRGVVVAHMDEGKGMGLKTDYRLAAALCDPCHKELTDGLKYTLHEKRALMRDASRRTRQLLGVNDELS